MRICQFCKCNEVEDECHFILSCPLYNDLRSEMFTVVRLHCPNLDQNLTSDISKLVYLFNSEGRIAKAVGQYCHSAFNRRGDYGDFIQQDSLKEKIITTRSGRTIKPPKILDL